MMAFNPTLELLVKPYLKRIHKDWAFWLSLVSVVPFGLFARLLPVENRADIVRQTVTLCVPLMVGLLAIAVAAFTIFATLSTEEFIVALKDEYNYLTAFFFAAMWATSGTMLYGIALFLLSFSSRIVATNAYFWACMVGLGLLLYCIVQVLDTGRTVSLQLLALPKLRKQACAQKPVAPSTCSSNAEPIEGELC